MPYKDPERQRAWKRENGDPERRRAYRAANLIQAKMERESRARKKRDYQAATVDVAIRHRVPWTPPEDQLVMDDTIGLGEIAFRLGRTYWACDNRRVRLRRLEGTRA